MRARALNRWLAAAFVVSAASSCTKWTTVTSSRGGAQQQAGGVSSLLTTGQSRLRLTTRAATNGILASVFGPAASAADTLVGTRILEFGGPCDRYATKAGAPECSQAFARLGIFYAISAESQATTLPQANTAREALRTRACDLITADNSAIAFAAQRATGGGITDYPGDADIRKAYALFYPGQNPPSQVVSALGGVVAEARNLPSSSPLEGWRYLMATLCLASDWQVL